MTIPDIGDTITCEHRGQRITGRIVGYENAGQRHRMPPGRLYLVQVPGEDGWREVHENALRETACDVGR